MSALASAYVCNALRYRKEENRAIAEKDRDLILQTAEKGIE